MKFRSRVDRPDTIPAPVGNAIEPVFEERIVDGVTSLVRVGGNPINEFVQESLHDSLVYTVIDRYQRGDVDALQRMSGQFMDVTGMPTTLAEAQQRLIDIERQFGSLPMSVRQRFDNSVSKFVSEISNGNAAKVFEDLGFTRVDPGSDQKRPSAEDLSKVNDKEGVK